MYQSVSGMCLAPSILSADFSQLSDSIKQIEKAQYVHIDVMDGMFVPNISFGAPVMEAIRPLSNQIFDVHLMIEEPGRYVEQFAKAGADILCVHAEACKHLDRTLQAIKEAGCKAAVALNPATPLSAIQYVLDKVDMVLIMSVNPGFGGQKLIPAMLPKIEQLVKLREEAKCDFDIEVDGGVTLDNVSEVIRSGANIIVAGSAVFKGNVTANVDQFLEILNRYQR